FLTDPVERVPDRALDRGQVTGADEVDGEPGAAEVTDEFVDIGGTGFGRDPGGLGVEHADGATDVGHGLAAEPFGVDQCVHGLGDVVVGLQGAAGGGEVQQGDRERVGDHVVHLAGDAAAFLVGGAHRA